MTTTSNLLEVSQGLKARAQRIQIADGYNTNAGLSAFNGRRNFSRADTYPLVSVLPGAENAERLTIDGELHLVTADIDVVGLIDNPGDDLATNPTALRQDMKRALLLGGDDLACKVNDIAFTGSDEPTAADDETDAQVIVTLRVSWHEYLPSGA